MSNKELNLPWWSPSLQYHQGTESASLTEVFQGKACLNIDGSKQAGGRDVLLENFLASCLTGICMVLITTLIHSWMTKQIDFVLACTLSDVECEAKFSWQVQKSWMLTTIHQDYSIKLCRNLSGKMQADWVWNQYSIKFKEIGFIPSNIYGETTVLGCTANWWLHGVRFIGSFKVCRLCDR